MYRGQERTNNSRIIRVENTKSQTPKALGKAPGIHYHQFSHTIIIIIIAYFSLAVLTFRRLAKRANCPPKPPMPPPDAAMEKRCRMGKEKREDHVEGGRHSDKRRHVSQQHRREHSLQFFLHSAAERTPQLVSSQAAVHHQPSMEYVSVPVYVFYLEVHAEHVGRGPQFHGFEGPARPTAPVARDALRLVELLGLFEQAQTVHVRTCSTCR